MREKNRSGLVRFEILIWLYRPEKFPVLSRNWPQEPDNMHCYSTNLHMYVIIYVENSFFNKEFIGKSILSNAQSTGLVLLCAGKSCTNCVIDL